MELKLERVEIPCLALALQDSRTVELSQQIKVPEGMPDVGQVLCVWGQGILRGKEWEDTAVSANGGVMVWVLYQPEDGSQPKVMDTWLPFQSRWELPEDAPEGTLRLRLLLRQAEGRSISPRKIQLRCGVSLLAEAYVPQSREAVAPEGESGAAELLEQTYPVRVYREVGEKAFPLEEELHLPDSAPQPEQIVYSCLTPEITDQKVLGDKAVFRGNGELHLLYRSEEGRLQSWNWELPFSQYIQLDREYGSDARVDTAPVVTNLETELDSEGLLRLKAGLLAQYRIAATQMLTILEDAYCPGREVSLKREELVLPVVLEQRREELTGEQKIPVEAGTVADVSFYTEFPRQRREDTQAALESPGIFQILYYTPEGTLASATARWEGSQRLSLGEDSALLAIPQPGMPQAVAGNGQVQCKVEISQELTTTANQSFPMVAGVELGAQNLPDPNRPTLILRRAGDGRLWDIAKESGSTRADIRRANGLEGEPLPGQMLLIPVR